MTENIHNNIIHVGALLQYSGLDIERFPRRNHSSSSPLYPASDFCSNNQITEKLPAFLLPVLVILFKHIFRSPAQLQFQPLYPGKQALELLRARKRIEKAIGMESSGKLLEKALHELCKKVETGLELDGEIISGLFFYCEMASPLDAKEFLDNIIGQEAGKSVIEEYLNRRGHVSIGNSSRATPTSSLHAYVKPCRDEDPVIAAKKSQRTPKRAHVIHRCYKRFNCISSGEATFMPSRLSPVACTTVIDDQSDYYYAIEGNSWLSAEEKELLQKKREELEVAEKAKRSKVVMTFDMLIRKVLLNEDEAFEEMQNRILLRRPEKREAIRIKTPKSQNSTNFIDPSPMNTSKKKNMHKQLSVLGDNWESATHTTNELEIIWLLVFGCCLK